MDKTKWRPCLQKWFLMKARDVPLIESMVDLSGRGAPQEFQRYAWLQPESLLPLCREFKRIYYAFLLQDLQPIIRTHVSPHQTAGVPPENDLVTSTRDVGINACAATTSGPTVRSLEDALQHVSIDEAMTAMVAKFGLHAMSQCISLTVRNRPSDATVESADAYNAVESPYPASSSQPSPVRTDDTPASEKMPVHHLTFGHPESSRGAESMTDGVPAEMLQM
jgi:hypothetical protein